MESDTTDSAPARAIAGNMAQYTICLDKGAMKLQTVSVYTIQ